MTKPEGMTNDELTKRTISLATNSQPQRPDDFIRHFDFVIWISFGIRHLSFVIGCAYYLRELAGFVAKASSTSKDRPLIGSI